MALSETARYVDGPSVRAWILERNPHVPKHSNAARKLCEWKKDTRSSVYTADRVLVELGFHLSELPDTAFRSRRYSTKPTANRLKEATKEELRARIRAGAPIKVIAKEFGVAPSTVRSYRRAMSHPA